MKIAFYTDVHWSKTSSVLKRHGNKYSRRLELCIDSVNWAEQYAQQAGVNMIICGGDFFDKNELSAEEITALQDVNFSKDIPHIFLVGNHELSSQNDELTTSHLFRLIDNCDVVDTPSTIETEDINIVLLPYIDREYRKPLSEYVKSNTTNVVFSHNDIAGIQMGSFVSKEGFSIEEIEQSCDLFINGHIHNGSYLNNKKTILNVGNLLGQNFSEDGYKYKHNMAIIDTETMKVDLIENPYAVYFYRIEDANMDADKLNKTLSMLKPCACLALGCSARYLGPVKEVLDKIYWVEGYHLNSIAEQGVLTVNQNMKELSKIDHIQAFVDFSFEQLGQDELLKSELEAILCG